MEASLDEKVTRVLTEEELKSVTGGTAAKMKSADLVGHDGGLFMRGCGTQGC